MLDNIFNQLQLKKEHTLVYSTLLESGPLPAGKLAKRLNMPRSSLYGFLQDLAQKGLVLQSEKQAIKIWQASPPEKETSSDEEDSNKSNEDKNNSDEVGAVLGVTDENVSYYAPPQTGYTPEDEFIFFKFFGLMEYKKKDFNFCPINSPTSNPIALNK